MSLKFPFAADEHDHSAIAIGVLVLLDQTHDAVIVRDDARSFVRSIRMFFQCSLASIA
jgi:hypothetical protein